MISKNTYDTSIRYAHDRYRFEAPETKDLLKIIKLERKHRDVLDVVEDKLMEIRDTDKEYIIFDCPKKDYNEIKAALKYYRYAFYDKNIKKKDKDAITYEVNYVRGALKNKLYCMLYMLVDIAKNMLISTFL